MPCTHSPLPTDAANSDAKLRTGNDFTESASQDSAIPLAITLVGSRVRASRIEWRGSDYVEYRFRVSQGATTWEVGRRFSEFRELHRKLARSQKMRLPHIPSRSIGLFDHSARRVRVKRQYELQVYINSLMTLVPNFETCDELRAFLQASVDDDK